MSKKTYYETTIGLEVHAQLKTESKIFCSCSTKFGAEANSQTCPICLGLPGILPVLNKKAVAFALKVALALNCNISDRSFFARKNYFYPDLPKGYQISQYEQPLATDGYMEIEINDKMKRVGIKRVHLEEDAGKSIHAETWVKKDVTLLDFNRCGIPLVEIVSQPHISSPSEAHQYLKQLRQLLMYLDVCDGNMEKGSLRCDANISVKQSGQTQLGVKTELKNMNSLKGVEKALESEKNRQISILENGGRILQNTLLWDETKNLTIPMRTKESEYDYRYFQEPDLRPLQIDKAWKEKILRLMPELPLQKRQRFISQYKISQYHADVLTADKDIADYYEKVVVRTTNTKRTSNWVMGEVMRVSKDKKYGGKIPITAESLADLIKLIEEGSINNKIAKNIFDEMIISEKSALEIVQEKELIQLSNWNDLELIVEEILAEESALVKKYKDGKKQIFEFFMGLILKKTKGKANPKLVSQVLKKKLLHF